MVWSRTYTKPAQVNEVLRILNKEYAYFVRFHDIAMKLLKRVRKHKEGAVRSFKKLERFEAREQMRAPVRKLETAIKAMLPIFDSKNQVKISNHAKELKVFEGKLLFDTVKLLEPEILNKNNKIIDWKKVEGIITEKVMVDLQALVAVDTGLRKIIDKGPERAPARRPAFGRQPAYA